MTFAIFQIVINGLAKSRDAVEKFRQAKPAHRAIGALVPSAPTGPCELNPANGRRASQDMPRPGTTQMKTSKSAERSGQPWYLI